MREIKGDIWNCYDEGNYIAITTNGTLKKDGSCVMGRDVALQAKKKIPELPFSIGMSLKNDGNKVYIKKHYRIIAFPVKENWWDKASLVLIERSCNELRNLLAYKPYRDIKEIYMVRPGCGNGKLDWKDVKPILEKYLDDRFIVVEKEEQGGSSSPPSSY